MLYEHIFSNMFPTCFQGPISEKTQVSTDPTMYTATNGTVVSAE